MVYVWCLRQAGRLLVQRFLFENLTLRLNILVNNLVKKGNKTGLMNGNTGRKVYLHVITLELCLHPFAVL